MERINSANKLEMIHSFHILRHSLMGQNNRKDVDQNNRKDVDVVCGCGVHIIMDDKVQYHLSWSGGRGTNNLAEARALAGMLSFCSFLEIQDISIYGDSKVMIDHIRGTCHINYPHLTGWLARSMHFWNILKQPSISHIPRSHNTEADHLCKEGMSYAHGDGSLMIFVDAYTYHIQDFFIPGI